MEAPRFDLLLSQSTTAVLDPSFRHAFEDLCSKAAFSGSGVTDLIRECAHTRQRVEKQRQQKSQRAEQKEAEVNNGEQSEKRYKRKIRFSWRKLLQKIHSIRP